MNEFETNMMIRFLKRNYPVIRIKDDKVFFGVCSGLGIRTNIDPLVWRLLFFFLIFSPVPIITGYLLTTILTKSI